MSNPTNEQLTLAYQAGDRSALLPLWRQVEKLAAGLVRRYIYTAKRNGAVDFEDLMQAASLGAAQAASTRRPDAGAFATAMGFL